MISSSTQLDFLKEVMAEKFKNYGPDMQNQASSLVEELNWEHKEDIIRCAISGSTPVRVRMWQALVSMGVIEKLPGRALDGWVLTDLGKAVAHEVLAKKDARNTSSYKPV
jgi:hypothetical protein